MLSTPVSWRPRACDVFAFLCLLSGGFTLSRVGLHVPVLNQPRFLLLYAAALTTLAQVLAGRPLRRRRPWQLWPSLALLAYLALSSLWAPHGARIGKDLVDLAMLAGLLAVYDQLAREDVTRTVRAFVVLTFWSSSLYFVVAAAGFGHDNTDRWAALGGGPNVFIRIMLLGALAAAVLWRGAVYRWAVLAIPLFLGGAFLSGSRGGMISAVVTAAIVGVAWVCALPRRRRARSDRVSSASTGPAYTSWRSRRGPLLRWGLTSLVALALIWLVYGHELLRTLDDRIVVQTIEERYSSARFTLFESAWDLFTGSPLHGVGLDGFYVLAGLRLGELYPHNLVLAVAAEGGAIGLVLLAAAAASAALGPRLPAPLSPELRFVVIGMVFVFAASQFSGSYYDAREFFVLLVLWGWRSATAEPQQDPAPVEQTGLSSPAEDPATTRRAGSSSSAVG